MCWKMRSTRLFIKIIAKRFEGLNIGLSGSKEGVVPFVEKLVN